MVPYAILYIYFLVVSMNQFCIQACGKVSIDQNPRELAVGETTDLKFTCTVKSDCPVFSSYVEKGKTILAQIPANGFTNDNNINITGTPSGFTATIKKTKDGTHLGTYYCGALISVDDKRINFIGCGTHAYSGTFFGSWRWKDLGGNRSKSGPSFGTKTGIVVAILWACVGMIYKEL